MENDANEFIAIIQDYALNAFWALVIFFVGKWLAKLITTLTRKTMEARKMDSTIVSFLCNVLYAVLLVIVILMAADALRIETMSVVAVLTASTFAVGIALKDSLGNFAAGVMLIMFRHFRVGDFIQAAGIMGIVREIKIFDTRLSTPDNKVIIVPNGQILGGPITNFSANDTRRMDLVVGVSYDDDIRKVKEVLNAILAQDEGVLKDPAPTVGLLEMADSSLNFAVRPWVKTAEYWDVFFRLQETIRLRLDEEGISIPYPQRDVHLHQVEAPKS